MPKIADLETKILETLDRLTQDVKVEDSIILVSGFYAGMKGYTPLSAILKLTVGQGTTDETLIMKALNLYFLANGVFFPLLLQSTPAMKQDAANLNYVSIDRMDPRKITTDYLYERLMELRRLTQDKEHLIDIQLKLIDDKNTQIIATMGNISTFQATLDNLQGALAHQTARMRAIEEEAKVLDAQMKELWKLILQTPAGPEKVRLTVQLEDLQDKMAALVSERATLGNEINYLNAEISNWKANIATYLGYIETYKLDIEAAKARIEQLRSGSDDFSKEIAQIDRLFLKRDLAMGCIGMIEAYAITRPGTVSSIAELVKGIGEIIPL